MFEFRFQMDMSWSETGDRYLLKLFRDYLFHQITETGKPWIDMAHIVTSLNKVIVLNFHLIGIGFSGARKTAGISRFYYPAVILLVIYLHFLRYSINACIQF